MGMDKGSWHGRYCRKASKSHANFAHHLLRLIQQIHNPGHMHLWSTLLTIGIHHSTKRIYNGR
eukprot:813377-Karenia_brevis.AAC.1